MSRNIYSQKREDFITKQTDKLNRQIDKAQNRFLEFLFAKFLEALPTDENDKITPDLKFHFLPSKLDKFYDDFLDNEIRPIMEGFTNNVDKLLGINKKYFDSVKKSDIHDDVGDSILKAIGITGSVVMGGSLLYSILADRSVIGAVKTIVVGGSNAGLTITALRSTVEHIVLKKDGGIIKNLFEQTIPDPYVKLDRAIGAKYATDLKLNYMIYQGGIIKTSREFCIERNNKVFSRDEVMKFGTPQDQFGGYTNKALGEFQGKSDPYNPFTDLGGYNCRHQLDYISDELAFHLRPELKNNFNPRLN